MNTWMRGRDKYGRTTHTLYDPNWHPLGVVVALPRVTAEPGRSHLSNDWTLPQAQRAEAVRYHPNLAAAKARLERAHRGPR